MALVDLHVWITSPGCTTCCMVSDVLILMLYREYDSWAAFRYSASMLLNAGGSSVDALMAVQ